MIFISSKLSNLTPLHFFFSIIIIFRENNKISPRDAAEITVSRSPHGDSFTSSVNWRVMNFPIRGIFSHSVLDKSKVWIPDKEKRSLIETFHNWDCFSDLQNSLSFLDRMMMFWHRWYKKVKCFYLGIKQVLECCNLLASCFTTLIQEHFHILISYVLNLLYSWQ